MSRIDAPGLAPLATPGASSTAKQLVPTRSWRLLALLLCASICCWMYRFLPIILTEPIKRDLSLSDTHMGLITGFAFSLVYSIVALPTARLVDQHSRRFIFPAIVGAFSLATMLTGAAGGFATLALARLTVAATESGLNPTALSLISDSFSTRLRGRAISIYTLGAGFGMWAGLAIGGTLNDLYGWRIAFALAGVPGVALALVALVWLKEPGRGSFDNHHADGHTFSLAQALAFMRASWTYIACVVAIGLLTFSAGAFEGWAPTYLVRNRSLSSGEAGMISGAMSGLGNITAVLASGFLADHFGRNDSRWYLLLPLVGMAIFMAAEHAFLRSEGLSCYLFYFLTSFGGGTYIAPLLALCQMLLPPRIRALGSAIMLVSLNLVGMGGGIFMAGFLSDRYHSQGIADPLGSALMTSQIGAVAGCLALCVAVIWVRRDVVAN